MLSTVATNYELHLKRVLFPKGALFWLVRLTLFTFFIIARGRAAWAIAHGNYRYVAARAAGEV